MENSRTVTLSKRRSVNVYITLVFLFTFAFWLRVSPAFAVDEAEFACNGSSGTTCDVFQLDGGIAVPAEGRGPRVEDPPPGARGLGFALRSRAPTLAHAQLP